jgi:hypothetical protein
MVVESIVSPIDKPNRFFFRIFDGRTSRSQPADPNKYYYVDAETITNATSSFTIRWEPLNYVVGFFSYSLYGRLVRKYFPTNKLSTGGWFWGKVTLYSPQKDMYTIEYEDGDWEQLTEKELLKVLRTEWTKPNHKRK